MLIAIGAAMLGVAGCAQAPQQVAATAGHSKEYFPSSVYGPASRRVIADGQPIPHGGGQYLVGKPYTIAGQTYYPSERKVTQVGLASWYGDAFHGRLTANGEVYDRDGFTAAHPTMPLPSYARVTNLRNHYAMIVRVNDRGPYHSNRVMDVSRRVAEALDFQRGGTAQIKVEYVGKASLAGSDYGKLYATLHHDGPATNEERTLVAEVAPPPARVASLAPQAIPARPDRLVEGPRRGATHAETRAERERGRRSGSRDARQEDRADERVTNGRRSDEGRSGDRRRTAGQLPARSFTRRLARPVPEAIPPARPRIAASDDRLDGRPTSSIRAGAGAAPRAYELSPRARNTSGSPPSGGPRPSATKVRIAAAAETGHRDGGALHSHRAKND